MGKKLIDQRGVESGYGIPSDTMDKLRARGVAPPWMRIGHKIYFRVEQLEKWLDEQQEKAGAEAAGPGGDADDS